MIAIDRIDLILASGSRYRGELLRRITPRFRQLSPDVDETARHGEAPAALAARLARAKAQALAPAHPGSVIIGSDQVAELDGASIGKPGSSSTAAAQLAAASGRSVTFHTAVCVVDARRPTLRQHEASDTTRVVFRALTPDQIERYVQREQPLDCAGSFKAESLGIALFERIESDDPTALVGLPLIALCRLLGAAGIDVI